MSGQISYEEENRIIIDRSKKFRACVFFPNRYEIATANLGFHWVYRVVNKHKEIWGERFTIESPRSIDSGIHISQCDLILVTVSFENDLLNLIKFFRKAGCSEYAFERGDFPPVVMGGAVTFFNPYPFIYFVDAIVLGEGEGKLEQVLDHFLISRGEKQQFLTGLNGFEWILSAEKLKGKRDSRVFLKKEDGSWSVFFSNVGEFGLTFLIEIQRGCSHLCRFCGAGFTYLPPREFSTETIFNRIEEWGYGIKKVGLISPSPGDHSSFLEILDWLLRRGKTFTLSSVRADLPEKEFFSLVRKAGLRTITLAPEAGSEKERIELNKFIANDTFFQFADKASKAGVKIIKLYFILGRHHNEEGNSIVKFLKEFKRYAKGVRIDASFSIFVPKPFTPFQWRDMIDFKRIMEEIKFLKKKLPQIGIKSHFEDPYDAFLEAVIAKSDYEDFRKLIVGIDRLTPKKVVKKALETQYFRERLFVKKDKGEQFPWLRVETSLKQDFLWREFNRSIKGIISPPCMVGICKKCGVCNIN